MDADEERLMMAALAKMQRGSHLSGRDATLSTSGDGAATSGTSRTALMASASAFKELAKRVSASSPRSSTNTPTRTNASPAAANSSRALESKIAHLERRGTEQHAELLESKRNEELIREKLLEMEGSVKKTCELLEHERHTMSEQVRELQAKVASREEEMAATRASEGALKSRLVQAEMRLEGVLNNRQEILATNTMQQEAATTELEALRERLLQSKMADGDSKRRTLALIEENKKLKIECNVYREKVAVCTEKLSFADRQRQEGLDAVHENERTIASLEQRVCDLEFENRLLMKQKGELAQQQAKAIRDGISPGSGLGSAVVTLEDRLADITVSSQQQQKQQMREIDEYRRGLLLAEKNKLTLVDKVVDALDGIIRNVDGFIEKRGDATAGAGTAVKATGGCDKERRLLSAQRKTPGGAVGRVFFSDNIPATLLSKFNALMERLACLTSNYVQCANDGQSLRHQLQRQKRQNSEDAHERDAKTKLLLAEKEKLATLLERANETIEDQRKTIKNLRNDADINRRHATLANNNNRIFYSKVSGACDAMLDALSATTSIEYFPQKPLEPTTVAANAERGSTRAQDRRVCASTSFDVDSLCSCLCEFVKLVEVTLKDACKEAAKQDATVRSLSEEKEEKVTELSASLEDGQRLRADVEALGVSLRETRQSLEEERNTHETAMAIIKAEVEKDREGALEERKMLMEEKEKLEKRHKDDIDGLLNAYVFLASHALASSLQSAATVEQVYERRIDRLLDMKDFLMSLLMEQSYRCHLVTELLQRSLMQTGVLSPPSTSGPSGATSSPAEGNGRRSMFRAAVNLVRAVNRMQRAVGRSKTDGGAAGSYEGQAVITVDVPSNTMGEFRLIPFVMLRASAVDSCPESAGPAKIRGTPGDIHDAVYAIAAGVTEWMHEGGLGLRSPKTIDDEKRAFASAASSVIHLFDRLSASVLPKRAAVGSSGIRVATGGRTKSASSQKSALTCGLYSRIVLSGNTGSRQSRQHDCRASWRTSTTGFEAFVDWAQRSLIETENLLATSADTARRQESDLHEERQTVVTMTERIGNLHDQLQKSREDRQRLEEQLRASAPVSKVHELEGTIGKLTRGMRVSRTQAESMKEGMQELQRCSDDMAAKNQSLQQKIAGYQQQQSLLKSEIEGEVGRSGKLREKLHEARQRVATLEACVARMDADLKEARIERQRAEEVRHAAVDELNHSKLAMKKQASIGMAQVSAIHEAVQIAKRAEEEVSKSRVKQIRQQEIINNMREETTKQKHRALLMREEVYASRHSLDDLQNRLRLADSADDVYGRHNGGAYGLESRPALPRASSSSDEDPEAIAPSSKLEYISLARAELQSIREDAKAKLGLAHGSE